MKFSEAMGNAAQTKLTENGAIAYDRLNGELLTLFGQIGSLRNRDESEIREKFGLAFQENALLATKMMFYAGNIHGGLGERRTFKICLKWMAENYSSIIVQNIELIPLFNRWDSIFELLDTRCEHYMWDYLYHTFKNDLAAMENNEPCSLLAKWLPSCNASSKKTRELGRRVAKNFYMTERTYRTLLSSLRGYLRVVEKDASTNQWSSIDYNSVPSYAMKKYREAFKRNDEDRFSDYCEALKHGGAKINASVLYPYDLVGAYRNNNKYHSDLIIEEQWKALPNYLAGDSNILVMADVSGSMEGRPMNTSIGLAIYFAQRTKGDFHNLYMTFTDEPHFIKLHEGASLYENIAQVERTDVGYSTNLERAFDSVLETAIKNRIKPTDMPKAICVISDMEIDRTIRRCGLDFVDTMRHKFERAGYNLPKLILWNVEARNDTFLSQDPDVIYVSGQSASVFKNLCGAIEGKDAYDVMLETLNSNAYSIVKI